MNRKNLTAAVLAGLAGAIGIVGTAQAVNVNPDGLGQVLLYPYYTTNGGNITALSVVNTTDQAKAVKVRFLEGQNSREVLDFNLYMSAWDVWTAALYDDAGTPTMVTRDSSCTVPYIYGNGMVQEFLPWALDDSIFLDEDADGDQITPHVYDDISRGSEGHFNMIEMGTLVDSEEQNPLWVNTDLYPTCVFDSAEVYGNPSSLCDNGITRAWTADELDEDAYVETNSSATAVTHGEDGMPADCQQLVDAWTYGADSDDDGYWIVDNFADIEAPSGGLFGGASIVNVANGTMFSYDAKAVDGFYVSDGNYVGDDSHQEPGTILPSLDSGNTTDATVFVNGDTTSADWDYSIDGLQDRDARSVDAVSFVVMHDQIMNEYTTEDGLAADTEWVITFPTKQFYVHQNFLEEYADFRDDTAPTAPLAPFKSTWTWVNTTYVESGDDEGDVDEEGYVDYPCEVVTLDTIWDREEQTIVDPDAPPGTPVPPIVSPAPPPGETPDPDGIIPFELCYETSVIAFGAPGAMIPEMDETTPILGSSNFHRIDNEALGFDNGWARLNFQDTSWDEDGDGGELDFSQREQLGGLYGLPVTGFAVERFLNGFLGEGGDVLANYGGIFTHKGTRTDERLPIRSD